MLGLFDDGNLTVLPSSLDRLPTGDEQLSLLPFNRSLSFDAASVTL